MGTLDGNRIAKLVYYSDPRHHDRVDRIFAFSFLLMVGSALVLFWTDSVWIALASMVSIFLAFCVMLLCMGFDDLLGNKAREGSGDGETEGSDTDAFKSGDAFEDGENRRGPGRGPKRKT